MSNGKIQPDEIRIEWEYDKDYRMVPANGMWGGITPKGDLRIDFFVEVTSNPGSGETALFRSGSGYKERRKVPEEAKLVRKVQVGVMIPPQQIPSFSEWFNEQAQRLKISPKKPASKVN